MTDHPVEDKVYRFPDGSLRRVTQFIPNWVTPLSHTSFEGGCVCLSTPEGWQLGSCSGHWFRQNAKEVL